MLAKMAVETVDQILAQIREEGGRVTTARRLVLTVLVGDERHLTADRVFATVQAMAPDIHSSTIYRNLEELERLGIVVHSHLGHGAATYHLTSEAHAHLVCERCDATFEAPDDLFEGMARRTKRRLGFVLHPYHFAVLGICAACAQAQAVPPAPSVRASV